MIFSIVEQKKINILFLNESLRGIIFSIAFVAVFIGIVVAGILLSSIVALILGVLFIFCIVIYSYYNNSIYSHIDYFTVIGKIEFNEMALKIDDEELAYETLKRLKFFVGYYKNYSKGRYASLCNGINQIEFCWEDKRMIFEFIIHTEKEYIKFEN